MIPPFPPLSRRLMLQACLVIAMILAGCAAPVARVPSILTAAVIPPMAPAMPAAAPAPVHEDLMPPIILKDVFTNIDALEKTLDWKPFRAGVEIAHVYNTPGAGPSAAFLRYQPGASVPLHLHSGYEHIFILKGTQRDRSGDHGPGMVIINPPGTTHAVTSPDGCVVFIIWEKSVVMETGVSPA